ncbi:MAG: peptidoglycan DD-metalloendopeptidase family protein [Rhodospirillales bacterium]|nr:peptidoglycan DD-metalloendopeptidase family protein [Rhodospirillales bacterium]
MKRHVLSGVRLIPFLLLVLLVSACFSRQAPAPYTHYGLRGGADSAGAHIVESGDTIWNISQRYRLSMQDVIYVNKLRPPYALAVGQWLKLPPPTTYTVRPGDSLYSISRTFNVSVTEVARQNHLQSPYTIQTGQVLRMPSLAARQAAAPRPSGPASRPGAVTREALDDQGKSVVTPAAKPSVVTPQTKKTVLKAVKTSAPPRSSSKFEWPIKGPILSSYGPKKDGLHNDGINIKAPKGAPVRAAENGVVVYAGRELEGYGNLVLVRHADRWMTAYAHMDRVLIKRGQEVKRGQSIGTVGSSGNVDAPQLHFEVRRGTEALNPRLYLEK